MWHTIKNTKIGLTVKAKDLDEVRRYFRTWMKIGVNAFDIFIKPDPDMCTPFEYEQMVNLPAQHVYENPKDYPDCWIGFLNISKDYDGDENARRMDDDLFWQSFSDNFKAEHGFRPRFKCTRSEAETMLNQH